jgi:hypothetical protein
MVLLGQGAQQRAPLPWGQGRVCGLADQRIAEQRDGLTVLVTVVHGGSSR